MRSKRSSVFCEHIKTMDSLANYGSDEEYEDNTHGDRARGGSHGKSRGNRQRSRTPDKKYDPDVNYEEVQMDLSEESNNSPKCDSNNVKQQRNQSHAAANAAATNSSSNTSSRRNRGGGGSSSSRRSSRKPPKDYGTSRYRKGDSPSASSKRDSSTKSRDRDNKYRDNKNGGGGRRRSRSRDRRQSSPTTNNTNSSSSSSSRDRRGRSRSRSRDRRSRRSGSRDRERERKPTYSKRYERASNKIAQLEKLGIEIKTPDCQFVTPKELQKSMEDQQKLQPMNPGGGGGGGCGGIGGGVDITGASNKFGISGLSGRFAEQIRKRKLLWQKKPDGVGGGFAAPTIILPLRQFNPQHLQQHGEQPPGGGGRVWENTTFAQDQDGKVASKFKRLMGIRNSNESAPSGSEIMKKQEEMFNSMEQQYEIARTATHTMRGVGLGFGSFQR